MSQNVDVYYNNLINNNIWPIRDEEISTIWTYINENFTDLEVKLFLKKISEDGYIFRWLGIIGYSLSKITYDDTFLEIVENTIEQVKNDMAQGNFIRNLIKIGEINQTNALRLYNSLIKSSELSIIYSGLVLGGIGKNDYEYMFDIVSSNFYTSNDFKKASYIKAIRVANEDRNVLIHQDKILSMLEHIIDNNNPYIKNEIVHFYFDYNKIDKKWSENKLLYLINKADDDIKHLILNKIWIVDLDNINLEKKILTLTSKEDTIKILDAVARTLSSNGKKYLETSLNIIRDWINRGLYYSIKNIKYCLNELGKSNYEQCMIIIKQWISEYSLLEMKSIVIVLSDLLKNIASYEYQMLLSTLTKWIKEDEVKYGIITINVIDDILIFSSSSDQLIDTSFTLLEKLSKNKELDGELYSSFISLFGSRPLFTNPNKMIDIITNWSTNNDKIIRKAIIPALEMLAEFKVDTQETLHMTYNKETNESKIKNITSKKVENEESVMAYKLLEELSHDTDDEVKQFAQHTLARVSLKLVEKEIKLQRRLIEKTQRDLRPSI